MRRTYAQAAASYYASMAGDCANRWEEPMELCPRCGDPTDSSELDAHGLCGACYEDETPADDPDDDPVAW